MLLQAVLFEMPPILSACKCCYDFITSIVSDRGGNLEVTVENILSFSDWIGYKFTKTVLDMDWIGLDLDLMPWIRI